MWFRCFTGIRCWWLHGLNPNKAAHLTSCENSLTVDYFWPLLVSQLHAGEPGPLIILRVGQPRDFAYANLLLVFGDVGWIRAITQWPMGAIRRNRFQDYRFRWATILLRSHFL